MEDRLQISQAHVREGVAGSGKRKDEIEEVFYCVNKEEVSFRGEESDEPSDTDMMEKKAPITDDDSSASADTKKLLPSAASEHPCSSCYNFFMFYRSPNAEVRVTPFAVILLAILFVIYILNQADRLVLPVAIPSGLRCELSQDDCHNSSTALSNSTLRNASDDCINFNDNEQGLLTGPAFTLIYVVAGLPLARLADTRSRPFVLLFGLLFWSVMVFLTGFVTEFWELLLLRIFLGVGEAACNPVAYSLLADFYPSRHRAIALSIYHYGVYVGGGLGWMIGQVNEVLGWRWTFRILGVAGFLMAPIAVLALWEPKAVHEKRMGRISGKRVYSIKEVFLFLVKSPPYWMLLIAGSIRNIPGYALGAWLPTFYVRRFGLKPSDYSISVGVVVILGGGLGSFLGGFLSDRLFVRWKNAKAYVIAVSQVLAAPAIVGVLLAPYPHMSYGFLFLAYVTAETWLGPAAAIVQDLCMPAMRAQASAIYIGVITIVASLGPVIVPGIMNHASFLDPCTNGVGYSLLMIAPTFYLLSAFLFAILGIVIVAWRNRVMETNIPSSPAEQEVTSNVS